MIYLSRERSGYMNLKFMVNDYILIWNLLFKPSISTSINSYKQKLWVTYNKEYNETYQDNYKILKDSKNFIPDDDTIYNIMMDYDLYKTIRIKADKYRLALVKVWDKYKKNTIKELKDILRIDLGTYNILVVDPRLNTTYSYNKTIVWGFKEGEITTLVDLVFNIVKIEFKDYQNKYKDIVRAVLELAIINEYATRIDNKSHYLEGDNSLNFLKRQIYPYFLMYLGVKKEEMTDFMNRDKIGFDINNYTYERQLKKVDLYTFIKFCIDNQKYIVKINELEII